MPVSAPNWEKKEKARGEHAFDKQMYVSFH